VKKRPFVKRRTLGLLFLAIAFAMMVAGLTVLEHKLGILAMLTYWTTCFMATMAALVYALVDLLQSVEQSRCELRTAVQEALREIAERGGFPTKEVSRQIPDSR
jgi:hypothetical protein